MVVDPHGGWACTVSDRWLISRICAHKGTDAGSVTRGCHQQSRVRDAGLSFSVSGRDQFHVEISTSYRMDIRPLSRRRADRPNSSCSHALFRLCFSRISCLVSSLFLDLGRDDSPQPLENHACQARVFHENVEPNGPDEAAQLKAFPFRV